MTHGECSENVSSGKCNLSLPREGHTPGYPAKLLPPWVVMWEGDKKGASRNPNRIIEAGHGGTRLLRSRLSKMNIILVQRIMIPTEDVNIMERRPFLWKGGF